MPAASGKQTWGNLPGAALSLAIAESASSAKRFTLLLTADSQSAERLKEELAFFAPELPVLHFPDWETLPYDVFSPHQDIISQRIAALYQLPELTHGVLVVPITTALHRLAPKRFLLGSSLVLDVGQKLDVEQMRSRLEAAGYRCVDTVYEHGEFAVRGALIDLYPMGSALPYRIDLFDDEIETLRTFDPENQRSIEKVDSVRLLPAREFPVKKESVTGFRARFRERFDVDFRRCPVYQDLSTGITPAGIEYYLPLFFDETSTLFDYLPEDTQVFSLPGIEQAAEQFWKDVRNRFEERRVDPERPLLPPTDLFVPVEDCFSRLKLWPRVVASQEDVETGIGRERFPASPLPELAIEAKASEPLGALRRFLDEFSGRVLFTAESAGRREVLLELLARLKLRPQEVDGWPAFLQSKERLAISIAPLDDGLLLQQPQLALIAESPLFGQRVMQRRRREKCRDGGDNVIKNLTELREGAPVVHIDHGVGRYQGLITLEIEGQSAEFLQLQYAEEAKLYVPVASLHLIARYTGSDDALAPLHRLGSETWQKAKRKAAEQVRDVAAELLDIYARRAAREGYAFQDPQLDYDTFSAGFPFEETPDQQAAIEAVRADMLAPKPMDRLICGDVGFGKTEVAVRAAFAAASAGKQVAVLVPTTLLAEQHYRNFRDRFADYPLKVEVLSRFKSTKEIKAELEKVAAGTIDVIVGTHRLLQPDVKFKDLGMVIVDEEQRFGVRQKEALKALRANVHLLTLTATPIPRTLNMAMAGLRDLSIIATPPPNRLAVQTFITQWDDALLREAFQRELARGGQLYFLHNDVESIGRMQRELSELVPEARIGIAHGQMPERELEKVMLDFQKQRFNVLLSTTIIESGIDIPNANTIIINRADRFGLAQLHQLRGRVGRSHHRAYAYLVAPDRRSITPDAEKRLEAIASMDELGAGFTLATHDLEIRGAGELLGEDQSGQMAEVGFSLYTELLERAVRSIKQGKLPDLDAGEEVRGAEVELHVPALIPEDYLPDVHTRLTLYKRISSARDSEALRELQVEMIDRFGLLPDAAKHLFAIAELKLQANALGIRKLDLGENGGRIVFESKPNIDPMAVIQLIQKQPNLYAMDGPDKLRIKHPLPLPEDRFNAARALLLTLAVR